MLKFIPPKEDIQYRYASYGAGQMKVHGSVGAAKQSLANRCGPHSWNADRGWGEGYILEAVDGEWYVLYHVPAGTKRNDLPWVKAHYRSWGLRRIDKMNEYSIEYHKNKNTPIEYLATPMTTDEYVDWRLRVEYERLGIPREV